MADNITPLPDKEVIETVVEVLNESEDVSDKTVANVEDRLNDRSWEEVAPLGKYAFGEVEVALTYHRVPEDVAVDVIRELAHRQGGVITSNIDITKHRPACERDPELHEAVQAEMSALFD